MADIDNIEKRLVKIEGKVESFYRDQVRINNEDHRHIIKLEQKMDGFYRDQVRINNEAYRHVTKMEKRFRLLDKTSKKVNKAIDPRAMERNTMQLVDQALKAFDQKRGKR